MSISITQDAMRELIPRPRLNMLFSQGILHQLILVVAGNGYGKTSAVAQFAQKVDARAIWFHASNINNYTERFWRTLKEAMIKAIPSLGKKLKNLPFPRSYQEQDVFLRLFSEGIYSGNLVLLVLDNAQYLHNDEIRSFLASLLEVDLENFCMIVISDQKKHLYLQPNMHSKRPFRITADDLRYNDMEVRERLEMSGIAASDAAVAAAQKATDGWPLAMHVLTTHWENCDNFFQQKPFSMEEFMSMFYSDYYTRYSTEIQHTLSKLSLLPAFTMEIITEIGGCDPHEMADVVRTNPFVLTDHATAAYSFQVVYRNFLSSYFVVPKEERTRILRLAALHLKQRGFLEESILSYQAAGGYDEIFDIIRQYPYEKIDHTIASFFLDSLSAFPEEYVIEHPLVLVYISLLKTSFGKAPESFAMLEALLEQYKDIPEIAGEILLSLGELIIMQSIEEAVSYYRKASECLPNGSAIRVPKALYVVNKSLFKLRNTGPDALQKDLEHFKIVNGYVTILYQRSSESWYNLSVAEASYYQLDLETAREMAHKAVYSAALHDQYDLQCNAWFLLLRMEIMQGNLEEALSYGHKIDELIRARELNSLFILRDCIAGWFYLKIQDLGSIPRWLTDITSDEFSRLFPSSERDIILRVLYKIETQQYPQALAMIDAFIPYCETHAFWTIRLYLFIARAIVCSRLGRPDEALDAFKEAYSLTYYNNIIAPFVETGHHMRSLIGAIQRMENHGLDDVWLSTVYAKSSSYAKRINAMSREFFKKKATPAQDSSKFSLSAREIEVLKFLSQGLKYEEISDFMGISINGVKKHITSIYSKMGAINRADAIYIAMSEGILQ